VDAGGGHGGAGGQGDRRAGEPEPPTVRRRHPGRRDVAAEREQHADAEPVGDQLRAPVGRIRRRRRAEVEHRPGRYGQPRPGQPHGAPVRRRTYGQPLVPGPAGHQRTHRRVDVAAGVPGGPQRRADQLGEQPAHLERPAGRLGPAQLGVGGMPAGAVDLGQLVAHQLDGRVHGVRRGHEQPGPARPVCPLCTDDRRVTAGGRREHRPATGRGDGSGPRRVVRPGGHEDRRHFRPPGSTVTRVPG
jgi:hypothetical protein